MDQLAAPRQPDPTPPLCRDVYYEIVHILGSNLPRPIADTPEDLARRDQAAIAEAVSLLPANAEEAKLAARYVAACAHADDRLRLACAHVGEIKLSLQITAQYASMLRTACGARSLLLRVQTARRKHQANGATLDQDAAVAQATQDGMMEARRALAERIPPPATPDAATPTPPAAAPEPPSPPVSPEEEERRADLLRQADRYAIVYTQRSRLIRRFGRLPEDCGIEQPEPELLHAILTGNGTNQRWADSLTAEEARTNAGLDRHLCRYEEPNDEPIPA